MAKTKYIPKLTTTASDIAIDHVLVLLDNHFKTTKAIHDNYLSGDEDMLMELLVADEKIREEIADIEIEDSYDQLIKKVKDHDDYSSDDLLKLIEDEEGEMAVHSYLQASGYAIIKIDNLSQQGKLEDFVKAEIWPLYADQDKYSI